MIRFAGPVLLAFVALSSLAGCAGNDAIRSQVPVASNGPAGPTTATGPLSATPTTPTGPPSTSSDSVPVDCGPAQEDSANADIASISTVLDVTFTDQCTRIVVHTILNPGANVRNAAVTICDDALKYSVHDGFTTISVEANDGSEIASGKRGEKCSARS